MSRIHRKVISDMLGRFFLSTSLSTCLYVYLMWFIHEFLTLVHKFLKMYDHIRNISQWLYVIDTIEYTEIPLITIMRFDWNIVVKEC